MVFDSCLLSFEPWNRIVTVFLQMIAAEKVSSWILFQVIDKESDKNTVKHLNSSLTINEDISDIIGNMLQDRYDQFCYFQQKLYDLIYWLTVRLTIGLLTHCQTYNRKAQSCKMSQIWQIYLSKNIGRLG